MIWPLLVGAGIAGVSALMSRKGQKEANIATRDLTREQMAFQERMSSTAHQRSMADLRKAGLNPILGISAGGASAPAGASSTMRSETEAAVSSAKSGGLMASELKSMAASRELMYNQSRLAANASAREAANVQVLHRDSTLRDLQADILTLQIPALANSARVEGTKFGKSGAFIDRLRQMVLGGRGFFNPIGGR